MQRAEVVMKKKGPKVCKKGKAFDSATFEMQKTRKESNGSDVSDRSHEEEEKK